MKQSVRKKLFSYRRRLKNSFFIFTKPWSKIAFPLIKKVMPSLVANDFVGIQPMNLPVGLTFYLDFKYGLIVIIFDEELWWEENDKGEWICPQTQKDHSISDAEWRRQLDDYLIIPKWEIDYQKNGWKND